MEYSCTNKAWKIWDYIPGIYYNFWGLAIEDDDNRHIIFAGGQDLSGSRIVNIDVLYIYDLKTNKVRKTSCKVPYSGDSDVCIARDEYRDSCLVFGYIRGLSTKLTSKLIKIG